MEDKIRYIDILPHEFYKVDLISVKIETDEFTVKKDYFTIIDSGTTITYFPSELYKQVIEKLKQNCNKNDKEKCLGYMHYESGDLCIDQRYDVNLQNFLDSFPSLILKFSENSEISWKPQDYLVLLKDKTFCIGINEWGYIYQKN